jgi:hypothetical protein
VPFLLVALVQIVQGWRPEWGRHDDRHPLMGGVQLAPTSGGRVQPGVGLCRTRRVPSRAPPLLDARGPGLYRSGPRHAVGGGHMVRARDGCLCRRGMGSAGSPRALCPSKDDGCS